MENDYIDCCIPLGIGDIFMIRAIFNSLGINPKVQVALELIKILREDSKTYVDFITQLLDKLDFDYMISPPLGNCPNILHYPELLTPYKKSALNLSSYFELEKQPFEKPYVVFHTKVRATWSGFKRDKLKKILSYLFQRFECTHDIVLIGDRNTNQNNTVCFDIYDELMLLSNHNTVIDASTDSQLWIEPSIKKFQKDLSIIKGAEGVIGIGWGGYLAMTWAVTDKMLFYVDNLPHPILDVLGPEICCRTMQDFSTKLISTFSTRK